MTALILAYCNRDSVRPGETVRFMVSCEGASEYRADIVRLACSDTGQAHPAFKETVVETAANATYPGRVQRIAIGSSVLVPDPRRLTALASFTLLVHVWPTRPGAGRQALLGTWRESPGLGYGLELDERGRLSLRIGDGSATRVVSLPAPLAARRWQLVGASFDPEAGEASLFCLPQPDKQFPVLEASEQRFALDLHPSPDTDALRMAAWTADPDGGVSACHFEGKLDQPRLADRALERDALAALAGREPPAALREMLVAAWDFSLDIDAERISDVSGNALDGRAINLPARGMTGANWTGDVFDWRLAREQYGAIHFHGDDLYSAEWQADFSLRIPSSLGSGIYAARLRADDAEYYVPFYVRPPREQGSAKLLFLVPTATYMAYANIKVRIVSAYTDALVGKLTIVDPLDLAMLERPELGLSTYDAHRDGSPVNYSSRLRPVVNCRPKESEITMAYNNFACDLLLIDWLERIGVDYEVMTDEDLHREGVAALKGYRAVMTGSHPEYYSLPMLDAIDAFVRAGGRLMYMGGNGFYWRVAFHPELPGVIEHRRAQQNMARWNPGPGQSFHSFGDGHGGLWWDLGRAPQLLSGVGFVAQGFDVGAPYRRKPAANDPRAAFIFEGVDEELIGDFGLMPGGAAGIEIDRLAPRRGSPSHALVLASSEGHSRLYETLDEVFPGGVDPETGDEAVRADMVYFETPNGGAVFSVGSIAYALSLAHDDYDNNAARIAENVLRRFIA